MREARGLGCVILAAGASSRMGASKLTLPVRGTTIIGATLGRALEAGLQVVVVLRPGDARLEGALGGSQPGLSVAVNPDPDRGMLSSLQVGLSALLAGPEGRGPVAPPAGFFFLPADLPFVEAETYGVLARSAGGRIALPSFRGRRGHPVLVPGLLAQALLDLGPEDTMRDFIARRDPLVLEVGDPGTVRDVDTVEDYVAAFGASL